MTKLEFYDKLKELAPKGTFILDKIGWIRTKELFHVELFLNAQQMCPICYVSYKTTGAIHWNSNYLEAGKEMGLDIETCTDIVRGADNFEDSQETRNKLLEILQIEYR